MALIGELVGVLNTMMKCDVKDGGSFAVWLTFFLFKGSFFVLRAFFLFFKFFFLIRGFSGSF